MRINLVLNNHGVPVSAYDAEWATAPTTPPAVVPARGRSDAVLQQRVYLTCNARSTAHRGALGLTPPSSPGSCGASSTSAAPMAAARPAERSAGDRMAPQDGRLHPLHRSQRHLVTTHLRATTASPAPNWRLRSSTTAASTPITSATTRCRSSIWCARRPSTTRPTRSRCSSRSSAVVHGRRSHASQKELHAALILGLHAAGGSPSSVAGGRGAELYPMYTAIAHFTAEIDYRDPQFQPSASRPPSPAVAVP